MAEAYRWGGSGSDFRERVPGRSHDDIHESLETAELHFGTGEVAFLSVA